MPKLPAYVFRRPNGSYRYKRNVPKKLREVVGKGTLYRQLGESYAEAMRRLPKVHVEIEALFQMEQHTPMSERPQRSYAGRWARKLRIWSWRVTSLNTAKRTMP